MPTTSVNDDVCDCDDGSDEPGTGACAGQDSTFFYCINAGSKPRLLYSSRVGDGVCDCCDGSDEATLALRWPAAACVNSCAEVGQREREEEAKRAEELRQAISKNEETIVETKRNHEEY